MNCAPDTGFTPCARCFLPPNSSTPDLTRYFLVEFDRAINLNKILAAFTKLAEIELAEKDIVIKKFFAAPNDSRYQYQWYLPHIEAPSGWNIQTGEAGVILAVVDFGVKYDHEDLEGNIWKNQPELNGIPNIDDDGNGFIDDIYGWDFSGDNNEPMDEVGHGTHIAGIAAAATNNGTGVAGIAGGWYPASGCKIMCIKIAGQTSSLTMVAQGFQYAADNGASVINISSWVRYAAVIEDAVQYAINNGVLIVSAAGNEDRDCCNNPDSYYLALRDEPIIVAASDDSDVRWYDHSSPIPSDWAGSNYGSCVDVSAPGENIWSTYISGYNNLTGTSMAAPVVTGIAGLLKSERPDWDWVKLRMAIINSCEPIDHLNPGFEGKLGEGRVNVYKALRQTINPAAPSAMGANAVAADTINLKWNDNSDNEIRFEIFRSLYSSSGFSKIGELKKDYEENDVEYYQNKGLSPNTTYYYRVRAYNTSGASSFSNTCSARTFSNEPPAKPQNLTARAVSPSLITLSWSDVANEEGYKIDRKKADGIWQPLASKLKDQTSHNDPNVEDGTLYYYRVRAFNDYGYSPWSNAASAVTPLEPPTNLTASGYCYEVRLNWQDESGNEDGFKIERKTGSAYYQIGKVAKGVTSYADVDLPCGQTFYYRVRAYNSLVNSGYSNAVAVKTTSCSYCGFGLVLKMSADKSSISPGEAVTYTYEVKNKGEGDLFDLEITNAALGKIASNFDLKKSSIIRFTRTVVVRESVTVFGRVSGKFADGDTVGSVEAHACATVEVVKR
jgi:subtilisin family serine protease